MKRIPFNVPHMTGSELECITNAHKSGHLAGDGDYSRRCHALLEKRLGCRKALLTHSCTAALEMAAMLLDIRTGDEVIVPTFTFVSTANAFVLRGAKPVFCDVRPDTLNLDESQVEERITARTKAIVPVHYAGVGCEMDRLCEIASRHGLAIVEDNAHGLFGRYRGKPLGTFGCLATQSFHETKNIICGEGGAILINDQTHEERAEILREKGTNRSRFFRGEVDKYSWVDIGSSYLISEVLAAFLYAQLREANRIQGRREEIWKFYHRELEAWSEANGVQRPTIPAHCDSAWHMYCLLLPSEEARDRFIDHLGRRQIKAVFHYLPLHLSEYANQWGGRSGDCPVAEAASKHLVRLPFYADLGKEDRERVVESILQFES